MKLIKFHISKIKPANERIGKYNISDTFDYKVVGVFGYFKHKRNGWYLNGKEYFMFSKLKNQLSKLTISNIIAIASIIVVVIIFLLDKFYLKD